MERIGMTDYSRQEALDQQLERAYKTNEHVIIGCGGIGFWLGIFLAMMGCQYFTLIDGDKIEPTNLSRLPVPQSMVGKLKVIALRKMIRTLRPDTAVVVYPKHIAEEELRIIQRRGRSIRIWDCTDNARIQQKIYEYAEAHSFFYTKIGYEGLNLGMYRKLNAWGIEEATQGYRTTQANATSSALASGLGLFYGLSNVGHTFDETVNINVLDLMLSKEHKITAEEASHV